jgi:hypothetical protein
MSDIHDGVEPVFEIGPEHPLTYRQEIVVPLFNLLNGGESCAVVGAASMGKSRLLQFLLRGDVQQHYLGEAASSTLLILGDCNRLAETSEWGLYELILTALTEATSGLLGADVRDWLNGLRRDVITQPSALLARRHVELAAHALCRERGLRLCFILDEFDATYRSLPSAALANLRALRDADRYRVCYALMLRDSPERVRPPDGCEGFYELLSRSVLGLKPYSRKDATCVVEQIAARRHLSISPDEMDRLLTLSSGHPGLLVALLDTMAQAVTLPNREDNGQVLLSRPQVTEECRKLWAGLAQDEQIALSHLAQGVGIAYRVRQLLELKGLIQTTRADEATIFSSLFKEFVLTQGLPSERTLWLDEAAAVAWVEGQRLTHLTRLEFDLLRMLYHRLGQVCTRDDIWATLYPDEKQDPDISSTDNRVDSLVRHLRKEIEPDAEHPRYLLTVRGRGYKLVDAP